MPKINASDIPSYEGHEGVVENAHGVLFNVDPTKDLDGRDTDGNETEDGRPLIASPDAEPVRMQRDREGTAETERLDHDRELTEENPPAFGHAVPQSEEESTRAQREKTEDKTEESGERDDTKQPENGKPEEQSVSPAGRAAKRAARR